MTRISRTAFLSLCVFAFAATGAHAVPLGVVTVGAPAINCIFNTTCTVTVTDSIGNITLPSNTSAGRLQSRTFVGSAGAPAAGLRGYDYRVDMTQAHGNNCVLQLRIDFGPIVSEQYNGGGPLDQVFVVTSGGLGSVGIASASRVGNEVTFVFAGGGVCQGQTSYFFGLTASGPPVGTTASLRPTLPGPWVTTDARAPAH